MHDKCLRRANKWTLDEVAAAAETESVGVMPGSGRCVRGPRRRLLLAMQEAGVTAAGRPSIRWSGTATTSRRRDLTFSGGALVHGSSGAGWQQRPRSCGGSSAGAVNNAGAVDHPVRL